MKFIEIFKKREKLLQSDEYDISQYNLGSSGKIGSKVFGSWAVFVPVAISISCLVVIMSVVGIPTAIDYMKHSLTSVLNSGQMVKPAAPEVLFEDIKSDSPYYDSLVYLKKNGVITGYQDKSFRPNQELSRAELLKVIVAAKKQFPLQLNYNSCFKDVKDEWFSASVCLAKDKKWVEGLKDGSFHPNDALSRAEALKMMIEAFDIQRKNEGLLPSFEDVKSDQWYFEYVQTALDNGLISEDVQTSFFKPEEKITRGDAAQMLYRVLLLQ